MYIICKFPNVLEYKQFSIERIRNVVETYFMKNSIMTLGFVLNMCPSMLIDFYR